jgi:hypothetical protein
VSSSNKSSWRIPDLRKRDASVRYFLLCLATAVSVAVTAYLCAWNTGESGFRREQSRTRFLLMTIEEKIAEYREKAGKLPPDLESLNLGEWRVETDDKGCPLDAWSHRLHYELTGEGYKLYSLGRDGQPGGRGMDADLYAGRRDPENESLTLRQFAEQDGTEGIALTCIAAGVLAFPICWLAASADSRKYYSMINVLARLAATALFAVMAAVAICILHIPSGH